MKAVIFDLFETLITEWVTEKYTSALCAADLGVNPALYREIWESMNDLRNTGKITHEQAVMLICEKAGVPLSAEKLAYVVSRRKIAKEYCINYRHADILDILSALRSMGIKIGLISNCFSEEAEAFHKSHLPAYFDAAILSYEAGITKPDPEIYKLCAKKLGVLPSECLFVGDGGSSELKGAESVGMKPLRAMWYLNRYAKNIEKMPFNQAETPDDVLKYII